MQKQWCWRCKAYVPMFDEAEWAVVYPVFEAAIKAQKAAQNTEAMRHYDTLRSELARVFNTAQGDPTIPFWHKHRLAYFGPPCRQFGKLLRTAVASKCFECGSTPT